MRWKPVILSVLFLVAACCVSAAAQSLPSQQPAQCPADMVCITRVAALKAIEDGDARKALEIEKASLLKSIDDYKSQITDLRVKYVEIFGRYDEIKQQRVEWMAEKELLLKMVRPKKFGVINF